MLVACAVEVIDLVLGKQLLPRSDESRSAVNLSKHAGDAEHRFMVAVVAVSHLLKGVMTTD